MKIGILSTCEHYSWAGTEEVWFHFARLALAEGHQVVLGAHHLVAASDQVKELVQEGLQVHTRHPSNRVRLYMLKQRVLGFEMAALNECDVVLVNAGSLYDALNLPWINATIDELHSLGIPIVYFCHFCAESLPATNHHSEAISALASRISRWVFVSEHNRDLAQRQLATKFADSHVVMNGPRLDLTEPLPFPNSPPWTLGCVARMEIRWKGHDVLLDCLAQDQWRDRDWCLNLYGSGPDENHVRRLIKHYDLESKVTMCGYVRDMRSVWSECHAKVLTSHGEGTPLAVIEAMMCGRPTISTDVGGNREILEDDRTGFIADTATPRCFNRTLERAWEQRGRWAEMGRQSHEKAVTLAQNDPPNTLLQLVCRES